MKVYVVTTGEYSDYGIDKVFTNRKEAMLYCANRNRKDAYDEYRIEEYDTAHANIETDEKTVFVYIFLIGHADRYYYRWYHRCIPMYESDVPKDNDRYIYVTLPKFNRKKAEKIMYDRLAELNAREQGII